MFRPQSWPVSTSLTSSLNRLSEPSLARVDHDTVADHADRGVAGRLAFSDDASGDGADFGNSEDLHDFRRADNLFLHHRFEHAFDGILDVVDRIVDDRIEADFDLLLFGEPCVPMPTDGPGSRR